MNAFQKVMVAAAFAGASACANLKELGTKAVNFGSGLAGKDLNTSTSSVAKGTEEKLGKEAENKAKEEAQKFVPKL